MAPSDDDAAVDAAVDAACRDNAPSSASLSPPSPSSVEIVLDDGSDGGGPDENATDGPSEGRRGDTPKEEKKPPLSRSSRLQGYITLLVSSLYNYFAAASVRKADVSIWCPGLTEEIGFSGLYGESGSRERYAMSAALITVVVTAVVVAMHFDGFTPLGKRVWPQMFGPNKTMELAIIVVFTLLWFITAWVNTSVSGLAGAGNEQFNLFYSTWICLSTSFWILEQWSVSSGITSFESAVASWPNRAPAWLITFILSSADFIAVLDLYNNWEEGTKGNKHVWDMYSDVSLLEWNFLIFITTITFVACLAWTLAEIFRESKDGKSNKSQNETVAEGLTVHILAVLWVATACFATIPGGPASLLGNAYFLTWGTTFSIIFTLVWWLRDWRKEIYDVVAERREEYEKAKRAVQRRETRKRRRGDGVSGSRMEKGESERRSHRHVGSRIELAVPAPSPVPPTSDEIDDADDDRSPAFRPAAVTPRSPADAKFRGSGASCSSRSLYVSNMSTLSQPMPDKYWLPDD